MASTLARLSGVMIKPGVSKNGRLYTKDQLSSAYQALTERLSTGRPVSMYTSHGAADSDLSEKIAGRVDSVSLADDGTIRYQASLADTNAGRTMLGLVDTSGDRSFLEGVSIRGRWTGQIRDITHQGKTVTTADGLEIDGLDFTANPGVDGAGVDTVTKGAGAKESAADPHLIHESAPHADVTATEAIPTPAEVAQKLYTLAEAQALISGNTIERSDRGIKMIVERGRQYEGDPTGGKAAKYADPGYRADHTKRLPLDTLSQAREAWQSVHTPTAATNYTPAQLKRVKGRIGRALERHGATVDPREGVVLHPAAPVTEGYLGNGSASYRVCIDNGTVCIELSSYCIDPADLEVCARAAMDGAAAALASIDPDDDGDQDAAHSAGEAVKGAVPDEEDDMESSRPDDNQMESAPQTPPASADVLADNITEGDDAEMAEPTTKDGAEIVAVTTTPAPPAGVTFSQEQFEQLLAKLNPTPVAAGAPAESAPAAPIAEAAQDNVAKVDESAAIAAAVKEGIATQLAALGLTPPAKQEPVAESTEQMVARLIKEGLTDTLQGLAESGGIQRKGIVTEKREVMPGGLPDKPMHQYTEAERNQRRTAMGLELAAELGLKLPDA